MLRGRKAVNDSLGNSLCQQTADEVARRLLRREPLKQTRGSAQRVQSALAAFWPWYGQHP